MEKQFVNKLGIHWLKQNHKEEIMRFYKILPEQQRVLFDPHIGNYLNLGVYLKNKAN